MVEELSRREAKALLVPWSPTVCRGVQFPAAVLVFLRTKLVAVFATELALTMARGRYTVAKRNKAAANRVQGLQVARSKGHTPEWFGCPSPNADQKHLIYRIFCTTCTQSTVKASDSGLLGYQAGQAFGATEGLLAAGGRRRQQPARHAAQCGGPCEAALAEWRQAPKKSAILKLSLIWLLTAKRVASAYRRRALLRKVTLLLTTLSNFWVGRSLWDRKVYLPLVRSRIGLANGFDQLPWELEFEHRVMAVKLSRSRQRPLLLLLNVYLPAADFALGTRIMEKLMEWEWVIFSDFNREQQQYPISHYLAAGFACACDPPHTTMGARRDEEGNLERKRIDYGFDRSSLEPECKGVADHDLVSYSFGACQFTVPYIHLASPVLSWCRGGLGGGLAAQLALRGRRVLAGGKHC
ncbi:Cacna1h [Symbiodinium sp. CCMP2592]|nr:Cacna1h [Symbiodinium sp. CCMP2592]